MAVLHFTLLRARSVGDERWHPQQEPAHLADGTFELRIPYRDSRELVMDILRHGRHVRVVAPSSLADEVKSQLSDGLAQHEQPPE